MQHTRSDYKKVWSWSVYGFVHPHSGRSCDTFEEAKAETKAEVSRGERSLTRWFNAGAFAAPGPNDPGNAPRVVVRLPGVNIWDMSLSKRFPISRARLEFRAEIFNLLNHNNFGNPDSNISNATVGVITLADDGRATQFGLRFAW